jgi:phage tail sheath protein FI
MPVSVSYPGVYVEELPSGSRTITGVSTSITAFVGRAARGPTNESVIIHSFGEFERIFGGIFKESMMSYAVYQYFLNGGGTAVIVRVDNGGKLTEFEKSGTNLKFESANPGSWSKNLSLSVNNEINDTDSDKANLFNLVVTDSATNDVETYLNLSINPKSSSFVTKVLENESQLVRVAGDGSSAIDKVPSPGDYTIKDKTKEGTDGNDLKSTDVLGKQSDKTGIYALDNVDLFNLLCIPPYDKDNEAATDVYAAANQYCKEKRAILLVDPPLSWKKVADAVSGSKSNMISENATMFFPRLIMKDIKDDNRLASFVPCGAVAGVIARNDTLRGIWKAPAGIEANLAGVSDLQVRLTDSENGQLNPLGVNCLRIMPGAGPVIWGSRTLKGADRLADQWKYLSVRRTALYIEESLYRGTHWVVFEPNDDSLWGQIRLSVGAFMHDLFSKGAFQGSDPKQAYLVKCDKETTTQYDIDRGIVNILVGFAPLKPAEFVILKIQQLTGQEKA